MYLYMYSRFTNLTRVRNKKHSSVSTYTWVCNIDVWVNRYNCINSFHPLYAAAVLPINTIDHEMDALDPYLDLWAFESESDIFRRSDLPRIHPRDIPPLSRMNNGWIILKEVPAITRISEFTKIFSSNYTSKQICRYIVIIQLYGYRLLRYINFSKTIFS